MRRGTVLQYVIGSHRLRVVVVTADRYNPAHGLGAPFRERTAPHLAPVFLVPLTKNDWPTAATVDLSRMRPLDPDSMAGSAGQLTLTTLDTLTAAVRTYFGAAG